jgi:hypothetical protein
VTLQREMTKRLDAIAKDPDVAFGPFQPSSFRPVLETCAARLDASGIVLPADEELGPATEALKISPTFCVIVRTRRGDILRDDIRRLTDAIVQEAADLPETARRFVVPPPDVGGGGCLRGERVAGAAQASGATTSRTIAEALNARGIPAARGGAWHGSTVLNLLARESR